MSKYLMCVKFGNCVDFFYWSLKFLPLKTRTELEFMINPVNISRWKSGIQTKLQIWLHCYEHVFKIPISEPRCPKNKGPLHYSTFSKNIIFTLKQESFCRIDNFQDFWINLGIKPSTHLLEISIFSLNDDLVRLTKITNNVVKDLKILSFKVIFQCVKLVESYQKKFL